MSYVKHIQRLFESHGWDTDSSKSLHSEIVSSTSNFNSTALIEFNCESTLNSYYFECVTKLYSSHLLHYSLSAAETSNTADQVGNTPFKLVDVSVAKEQVKITMFNINININTRIYYELINSIGLNFIAESNSSHSEPLF